MKFKDLNIVSPLQKALANIWFNKPTDIQEQVIPVALDNKDILWCAQTWSWKTLAFVLPILNNMYTKRLEDWLIDWKIHRRIKTLVLAPTRELAEQIWETFKPYCTNVNFKHTTIFGWVNTFHQIKAIEKWVDILIATPWRLMDLVSQWKVNLSFVDNVVLDESDRILDMWNWADIKKILKRLRWDRQTFLFSATMPHKVQTLAQEILTNPEVIKAHKTASTTSRITQQIYHIQSSHKRRLLQYITKRKDLESILVFVRSRSDAERILAYIKSAWIKASSIHKDKTQNQRKEALQLLKTWKIKVLVATDIASRWLDIIWLSCVLNYDIPLNPDDYVHRIWRTGRAGKTWLAISLCIEADLSKIKAIESLIKQKLKENTDKEYLEEKVSKEGLDKFRVKKRIWRTNFASDNDWRWNKKKESDFKDKGKKWGKPKNSWKRWKTWKNGKVKKHYWR